MAQWGANECKYNIFIDERCNFLSSNERIQIIKILNTTGLYRWFLNYLWLSVKLQAIHTDCFSHKCSARKGSRLLESGVRGLSLWAGSQLQARSWAQQNNCMVWSRYYASKARNTYYIVCRWNFRAYLSVQKIFLSREFRKLAKFDHELSPGTWELIPLWQNLNITWLDN